MIQEWERSGELKLLTRQLPSDSSSRWVFCSKEVFDGLHGPWTTLGEATNMGRARGTLDAFITGRLVSVRVPPSKNVRAHLALLDDASEEVWEFRCRDPNPQIRIFGHFAEKDTFIAFLIRRKPDVVTDDEYLVAKEECKRQWRTYFPSYQPFSGSSAHDYVSNCAVLG